MAVDEQLIRRRVAFDIPLRSLQGNHKILDKISFENVDFSGQIEWVHQLCHALQQNDTCKQLSLKNANIDDSAVQVIVVALAAGAAKILTTLDLRQNAFSLAGETMLQGLSKLRNDLHCIVHDDGGKSSVHDGFVHDKMLVEGLTVWPAESLRVEGNQDLICPPDVSAPGDVVVLKKGFQGTNGTKYTCEDAEFELSHVTGNLVLKRLELGARMRLMSSGNLGSLDGGVFV